MPENQGFWLENWIEEFEVYSNEKFTRAISSTSAVKSLYDSIADRKIWSPKNHGSNFPAYSALAGRHLDLSGSYHHSCANCFSRELSLLLTQTMHFFDRVVVSGPSLIELREGLQYKNPRVREQTLKELRPHVEFLNYLRTIDARDKLIFAPKTEAYCQDCFNEWIHSIGMTALENEEQSKSIVEKLVAESRFVTMRDRSGQWVTKVSHPYLGDSAWTVSNRYKRSRPTRKEVSSALFNVLSRRFVYDLATSHHYKLPLIIREPGTRVGNPCAESGKYSGIWRSTRCGNRGRKRSRVCNGLARRTLRRW